MQKVSIFKNVSDPKNPDTEEILYHLFKIRDGEWEDLVNPVRLAKTKEERNELKMNMPTVCYSGEFEYRNEKGIKKHNGLINIDLDCVENIEQAKELLKNDSYVFAVWVSTSGTGLRVLFRVEPKKHREAFNGISQYLFEKYGLSADPNGVSLSKPYIVDFDPFIYINPLYSEVPVFTDYVKEVQIKEIVGFVYSPNDFDSIIKQIVARRVNICEGYSEWIKVGFAISEQFGASGSHYFHEVSKISSKYNYTNCENQYKRCLKARGTTKANISTFYYLAKINGISIFTEQTKTIIRITSNGKKAGLSKEAISKNLKKFSSIEGADNLISKIYDSDSSGDDYKGEDNTIEQLEMYISNNYNLKMNEISGFLENDGISLSNSDINTMFIGAKKLIPKLDYQLMIRLLKSEFVETFNPFFEYFNSDGLPFILPPKYTENNDSFQSPMIDQLSRSIINDEPAFTRKFVRKWIVSIISSMHKVHSPLLLALIGSQGTGKTEFFRRLLPKELSRYYAESKLDKEKDDELLMCENIIIMDDELGGKSKSDAQKLKNITSKEYFYLRRPYGDHNERILRVAVLCGTSNYINVVNDTTGNRRILPIKVLDIDKDLFNGIDKRKLFNEAYQLYKSGFDWRVMGSSAEILKNATPEFESTTLEKELLLKYFEPGGMNDKKILSAEIQVEIEALTRQRINFKTLCYELEHSGFEKVSIRNKMSGITSKRWLVKKINRPESEDLPF